MEAAYNAKKLPLEAGLLSPIVYFEELIDATTKLEVYKEKIRDSKLESSWFMPSLQQKEALASSKLEGTQATLDGVLIDQVAPNDKDKNLNEVRNYYTATVHGYAILKKRDFSDEFFFDIHQALMNGNVRKPAVVGEYRKEQNYIGKTDKTHSITFIPPAPDKVPELMHNLIDYINNPMDQNRPLVRTAIVHAQFETIHPFMDGNGRVGRMLIPMYLYSQKQIDLPYFFISEALERDKMRYYSLLNNIRTNGDWNSWIKFFLSTVKEQCEKYINIISSINTLHEKHLDLVRQATHSSNAVEIMNALFKYPITTAKQIAMTTNLPMTSINRYLGQLVENQIIFSDNKSRNRNYFYYDLLKILRS
ncbi:MAG: Fic family protein [Clostridiales bacterium]|nr:Fic family protein [Clostridiales bacterium]